MKRLHPATRTGHALATWPVLLVLLAAALVPTGCVLWFMNAAMRNERLAMRQRLGEVYGQSLSAMRREIDSYWAGKLQALDASEKQPAAVAADQLVRTGIVNSVIIRDAEGNLGFPVPARMASAEGDGEIDEALISARAMENDGQYRPAAAQYQVIADISVLVDRRARALHAAARCLVRAGDKPAAIALLARVVAADRFGDARGESGRLLAPVALLYTLQLLEPRGSDAWNRTLQELVRRVNAYDGTPMPSSQRILLMKELLSMAGVSSPMLAAEELAGTYVDADLPARAPVGLRRSTNLEIWTLASSSGRTIGLLRDATVSATLDSLRAKMSPLAGARVVLHHGAQADVPGEPLLNMLASESMPGWWLSLYLDESDPLAVAAQRQMAAHVWTAALGILLIVALMLAVGRYLGRQMRLTRLKNDLIATVSHELKTPLASMRVLVDTLLEDRCASGQQTREYLSLLARENGRLGRLIDNFLTFSRMERNKQTFEKVSVDLADVVRAAEESVRERFSAPGCSLDVQLQSPLPPVNGDRDALITVVVNLLDNAWKYTLEEKRVGVRVFTDGGRVCVEVRDNGIGLAGREMRRIFDRFYQVDRTLSRRTGGCGLGLSIVRFIVEAHGGTVSVDSRAGEGSCFTVSLPAASMNHEAASSTSEEEPISHGR